MRDQHLFKSPAIEVYGHCRLLYYPGWEWVPCWFFCNLGLKNCWPGIEPTTLDLSSQSGAHDLSATATHDFSKKQFSWANQTWINLALFDTVFILQFWTEDLKLWKLSSVYFEIHPWRVKMQSQLRQLFFNLSERFFIK